MEKHTVTPCAEFPNDNPALHHGAIWLCLEPTGRPVCERPEVREAEPIALEAIVPAMEPATEPAMEPAMEQRVPIAEAPAEPPTDPTPPVLEADDEDDDIEIVDELSFDEVVDESPHAPEARQEPASDDPFVALTVVLEAVARSAGATEVAIGKLRIALGRERVTAETGDELLVLREQAAAWQAILRGESEDFGACGVAALDEWSSSVVARSMGEMHRADGLRRELRRRGVAAFGLVIEAA